MGSNSKQGPGWPDVRGWATLAMFLLVFYVVSLIAFVPRVSDSELFKTIATLLLGSGAFGLVVAFLWGGSKATTSAIETVNEMAKSPQGVTSPDPQQVIVANNVDEPIPTDQVK